MPVDMNNLNPVSLPNSHYQPKGDIKTLVKIMRSQSNDFEDRDLVGEFNTISEKNTPCKSGSPKQPSIKFLNTVEKELKQANAHVGGTVRIANEYAKLLHNKHHLNEAYNKIQQETILNTLRSGGDLNNIASELLPKIPSSLDNYSATQNQVIPMGKINPQTNNFYAPPQQMPKIDIEKPKASYSLHPAPDIFSSPKTGSAATYRIVPFDLMAGA
jgi:hypothetical protein